MNGTACGIGTGVRGGTVPLGVDRPNPKASKVAKAARRDAAPVGSGIDLDGLNRFRTELFTRARRRFKGDNHEGAIMIAFRAMVKARQVKFVG